MISGCVVKTIGEFFSCASHSGKIGRSSKRWDREGVGGSHAVDEVEESFA
jgi:hypothetical protein